MYSTKSSYLCSKIPAAFQCTATQLSWQQLCTLGSVALCCRRQGSLKLRNRAMTQRSNSACCPEIRMKAASRSIEHCSFRKSGDPIGSQTVAGSALSSTGHIWKKKNHNSVSQQCTGRPKSSIKTKNTGMCVCVRNWFRSPT